MKKIVIALAVLAAAASATFVVSQATAHAVPTCSCTPTGGCVCGEV